MAISREIQYVLTVQDKASAALKKFRGAAVAAGLAMGALGVAAKGAADFEKAMREVSTLTPQVKDNFKQISEDVLEFSSAMGVDAVEATGALYQAISAGVPADNAVSFLETASKAAIGGVTDLETAVDGITSVVNAYNMDIEEAGRVSDVMFEAVKAGKTDFQQLSKSMFNVIPTAASLGVSVEEVSAALARMTAQGTPTSVATTSLRQTFVEASKSGTKLDKAIRALTNKGMGDLIGEGRTAQSVLQELRENMPTQSFKDLFGSVEGMNAALAITGEQSEAFVDVLTNMQNASGSTQAAFEVMAEGTSFQFAQIKESLKNLGIQIGSVLLPILNEMVQKALPVIESMAKWAKENPKVVKGIVLAVAGVSALILGITALLPIIIGIASAVSIFSSVMAIAGVTAGVLATAVLALPIAIGVAIAGVVALITAFVMHWDAFKTQFIAMWELIKLKFAEGMEWIKSKLREGFNLMIQTLASFMTSMSEGIGLFFSAAKTIFTSGVTSLVEIITNLGDSIKDVLMSALDAVKEAFASVFTWIYDKLASILGKIGGVVDTVKGLFSRSSSRGRAIGGVVNEDFTTVGENGPEIVSLPHGARVHTNAQSQRMMGGSSGPNVTVNISGSVVGLGKQELAEMLGDAIMRQLNPLISI